MEAEQLGKIMSIARYVAAFLLGYLIYDWLKKKKIKKEIKTKTQRKK